VASTLAASLRSAGRVGGFAAVVVVELDATVVDAAEVDVDVDEAVVDVEVVVVSAASFAPPAEHAVRTSASATAVARRGTVRGP
jgi:hypothetical protein